MNRKPEQILVNLSELREPQAWLEDAKTGIGQAEAAVLALSQKAGSAHLAALSIVVAKLNVAHRQAVVARNRSMARMKDAGASNSQIADCVGVRRTHAVKLIALGRSPSSAPAARPGSGDAWR